jgi:hypothetical protein
LGHDRVEHASDGDRVGRRIEGGEPGGVEVDGSPEVVDRPAVEDHTRVEAFAALDAGHDAQQGVLEGLPHA